MLAKTRFFAGAALAAVSLAFTEAAPAQGIGSVEIRPFVTGLIPVIGRSGSVGGVSIDARGVVTRSTAAEAGQLRKVRLASLAVRSGPAMSKSPLRKVSLRGLQDAIRRQQASPQPAYDDELQNLAGLQRTEYVFLDPDNHDLVLAGPAEAWRIDEQGTAVGIESGRPTLQLDDLVIAVRTARAATMDRGISCSIDPTPEGLQRLRPLLNARSLNESVVDRLERALGEQQITITGVPANSHFARVLVAADFCMKRLGMNFERAPVQELPSYLELLQSPSAPRPKSAMPRWWMAPNYEPLARDEAGLTWQLRGPGVQTLSEAGYASSLRAEAKDKDDLLAKRWADAMTAQYEPLSRALPVFAELRNCMDLAVIAALLVKEDLPARAACDLSLLFDERQVTTAEYPEPGRVDSKASFVKRGSGWILSLSGGVQVDSWSVLSRVETNAELTKQRAGAVGVRSQHWWWD